MEKASRCVAQWLNLASHNNVTSQGIDYKDFEDRRFFSIKFYYQLTSLPYLGIYISTIFRYLY